MTRVRASRKCFFRLMACLRRNSSPQCYANRLEDRTHQTDRGIKSSEAVKKTQFHAETRRRGEEKGSFSSRRSRKTAWRKGKQCLLYSAPPRLRVKRFFMQPLITQDSAALELC